jgi:tetratricopeptide (TPR) repeat protein
MACAGSGWAGDRGRSEELRLESKVLVERMGEVSAKAGKRALGTEALGLARGAVAADDSNSEAHLAVAITVGKISSLKSPKDRIGDSGEIRAAAERAIKLDPENDLAWFVLGRWNYELANLGGGTRFFAEAFFGKLPDASNERAVECLERSVALEAGRLMYRAELGRAYAAVGSAARAREELGAAMLMEPRDQEDREARERAGQALAGL